MGRKYVHMPKYHLKITENRNTLLEEILQEDLKQYQKRFYKSMGQEGAQPDMATQSNKISIWYETGEI